MTGSSVDENLWRNWSSQSWKVPGMQALQHSRGGRAAQRHYSVIAREWKLYQKRSCQFIKNPQWPTGKRSLRLLRWLKCLTALKNLLQISELYRYDALNLLSYMTLDVKNINSVVHHKDKLFTVLDYPRNYVNGAQGLMRTTHWAAYYLTNPNPWYPVPERARILSAIPAIQPLPPVLMASQSIQKMRD